MVLGALRAWLSSAKSSLDEFGVWGAASQEPEQSRGALLQTITATYAAVDPALMIQQSDAIAARLRGWTALMLPRDVTHVFQAASAALRAGGRPDLAAEVAACANEVSALQGDDPRVLLNSTAAVRRRVEAALRAAAPQNESLEARLAEGDFVAAAAVLARPAAPAADLGGRSGGAPAAMAYLAPDRLPRASAALAASAILPAPLRLRLPANLVVGEAAPLSIDWSDAAPPGLAITWECHPPGAADVPQGDSSPAVPTLTPTLTLTPKLPGFLTVVANIAGWGAISASSYVGSVLQSPDFKALERREHRVKLVIWCATAVLTTGVGFEIFAGPWLGTPSDFVSAFLWGFFGQFGLDRVRDLAKPVTAKAMSFNNS
jgi:hypothetical protein